MSDTPYDPTDIFAGDDANNNNQTTGGNPNDEAETEQGLAAEPHHGRVDQVDLKAEIETSYLEYAMSVIIGRALPDVRDGLKPVHRRVIYAMYDGGYRPDRGWNKSSRVVGEVMGLYHPHGDSAIYDTLVRLAQPWVMRVPLVNGQGNFGSPGNDPAAAMRYTECKMAPIAMEMVRDIDQNTVDFQPNYDNRDQEPVVLPSRFPNLLVNGSSGIAVGMATNIPTHNLREVADAVHWYLDNPDVSDEELLEAAIERIPGPDFPTGAKIVGRAGIENAYRTGRGSVTMRAVINMEEEGNHTNLVVTELPYMCNPDNLAQKIADLVNSGKLTGIADIRDDTSARTGQRLVITLKRDAQPRVVMNNLYKHTQLQDNFGCNMLAIVDNEPKTLRLDQFISYWVAHQIDVIQRRTEYRLAEAEKQAHIYRGLVKALDMLDEVIALIRASQNSDEANKGLQALLDIDQIQAQAILDMQLRRLAALERKKIMDRLAELEAQIADLKDILAKPARQRAIIGAELSEIVDKYGEDRKTEIVPDEASFDMEDFIPDDEMVVTITRGGYVKRTRTDNYRTQRRGGKGVRGASLRAEDEVEHLFTMANHDWLVFLTNFGRAYRIRGWQLPEASREAKGSHVAGLMSFLPDERIASGICLRSYEDAEYLLLATKKGLVKKTKLSDYDSARQSGLLAIKFRSEDDELIGALLTNSDDDVLLISKKGQALRFHADDNELRPTGRVTSGVTGMRFRGDDELLSLSVIPGDADESELSVFTVTDEGYAKRTLVNQYRVQGRGGLGAMTMRLNGDRGLLIGGMVVAENDEIISIRHSGQVVKSAVSEVSTTSRDTMGVIFVNTSGTDPIVAVALNPEATSEDEDSELVETQVVVDENSVAEASEIEVPEPELSAANPGESDEADETTAEA